MSTKTDKPAPDRAAARRRDWAALLIFFALLALYFRNHASFLEGMLELF